MVRRGLFGKIRGHPTVRPRANTSFFSKMFVSVIKEVKIVK